MARLSFTTVTLLQRLQDPRRWSEAERKAAIKTLQGAVNRAYDRSRAEGRKTFATRVIDKKGKIKTWGAIASDSYKDQMEEIRRGAEYLGMATLTKSGYDRYLKDVSARLGAARRVGAGKDSDLIIYNTLSEAEQSSYWDVYYSVMAEPGTQNRIIKGKLDSERLQRQVWELWGKRTLTSDDIADVFSKRWQRIEELEAKAAKIQQIGITFDPADLT